MCWCIFGFHVNCKGQKGDICLIFNIQLQCSFMENYAVVGYLLSKSPTVLSKRPSSSMIQTLAPGDNATHASHIDQFCKSLHRPYKFELCASQWNSINIQWGGRGRGDGIRSWLMSRCYLHLQRSRHLLHPPPATPHSQILSFNPSPIHCPSYIMIFPTKNIQWSKSSAFSSMQLRRMHHCTASTVVQSWLCKVDLLDLTASPATCGSPFGSERWLGGRKAGLEKK